MLHSKISSYLSPATTALASSFISENEEDSYQRRLSTNSTSSIYEDFEKETFTVYSEDEMQEICSIFSRIYKQYFSTNAIVLPELYSTVLRSFDEKIQSYAYFDSSTMDLFMFLLTSIQVRLFFDFFNTSYHSFIKTDLFEYVVNEIQSPSTDGFKIQLKTKLDYSIKRLESCKEEIPHVKQFIKRKF